ncbi:hypothetical protein SCA6_016167 [Theobroma cacao]
MVIPLFCIILTHLSTITVEDFIQLSENLRLNYVTIWLLSISIAFLATFYFMCRPINVYLVNFACYKPERAQMVSKELFMQLSAKNEYFTEESLTFQKKILERSRFGQTTYAPKALMQVPANRTMAEARKETETVMFGAIDELLAKTGVKPRDIGILVVNSSLFNPTPSLSAAIVNHYKLRGNSLSYNLGGMEQLLFFTTLVARKVLKMKIKPYIPDFKLAFEHFCIYAGGRGVLDELEKSLDLTQWHVEPSRMTLYRFGNTSSSSLWYELGYSEAKGRITKRDRVWQIGFRSGFKCNSAVWRAVRTVNPTVEKNPWMDEIDKFPLRVPQVASIV